MMSTFPFDQPQALQDMVSQNAEGRLEYQSSLLTIFRIAILCLPLCLRINISASFRSLGWRT